MRFFVRVARPRFEICCVTVEADDAEDAKCAALKLATGTERVWSLLDFSEADYGCHIERMYADDELDVNGFDPATIVESLSAKHVEDEKYILMKADTASGEGEIVTQKWFSHSDVLLKHDLCDDWTKDLQSRRPDPT